MPVDDRGLRTGRGGAPTREPLIPRWSGRWLVLLAAMALLASVVPSAVGTHNSRGASLHLVQPDEAGPAGALEPDVAPTDLSFHRDLPTDRPAPEDQSGLRYRTDQCDTWGKIEDTAADPETTYQDGLIGGTACYVGYLDAQLEYTLVQGPLAPQFPSDKLYPINPPESDGYCSGSNGTQEVTSVEPVDVLATRAQRSTSDSRCDGSGHEVFRTDEVAIDTDLLEAPVHGDIGPGVLMAQSTGTSGTLTLPLLLAEYVFAFGQPHPHNNDTSPFEAGEGVFGADPTEGGDPSRDLGGVCGERTRDCHLLTPEDLKRYDVEDPPGSSGKARLCSFIPHATVLVDQRTHDGRCGTRGRPVNAFFPAVTQGGLGTGAPTWIADLPGWHSTGTIQLHEAHHGATAAVQSYTRDDGYVPQGIPFVYAINPRVPTSGHPLDCLRPGILAEGDASVIDGIDEDDGVYGTYQADAIDLDLYMHPSRPQQRTVSGATHSDVRPLVRPVQTVAADVGGPSDVADALGLPPVAIELADRAEPIEDQPTEPQAQPGEQNERQFSRSVGPGLVCDGLGRLQAFETTSKILGGQHVDAVIQGLPGGADLLESYGLVDEDVPDPAPKDPTITGGPLPAREDDTAKGGWAPRTYSFHVHTEARLDTNLDGRFEGNCITATDAQVKGEPQDACVWTGIWDAYNPNCEERGVPCDEILRGFGYEVDAGVGLYYVLRITGPTLITPWSNLFFHESCCIDGEYVEDNTQLLGAQDPTAQNCVVGVSIGFADKLREQLGADLLDTLCRGAQGERVLIEDGMFRQFGLDSPPSNAEIAWTPLLPRPHAVQETAQTGLGDGDRLCVHGVWTVSDDGIAEDTKGNIDLGPGRHVLTDCDRLDSGVR